MNRLGKTVELIVKLENNLHDEGRTTRRSRFETNETRGLEAARDHEMLELEGTPQDIVDFRRQHVPGLIFHACPECGDELDPRQARDPDQPEAWAFICWECETSFTPALATQVESVLDENRIVIDPDKPPRNPVPPKPASMDFSSVSDLIRKDLEQTGATATK